MKRMNSPKSHSAQAERAQLLQLSLRNAYRSCWQWHCLLALASLATIGGPPQPRLHSGPQAPLAAFKIIADLASSVRRAQKRVVEAVSHWTFAPRS